MKDNKVNIIRVRRSLPGKGKYCACRNDGTPIRTFERLADVRKYWSKEIKWGYVHLVRELDQKPNMKKFDENVKMLESVLKSYRK